MKSEFSKNVRPFVEVELNLANEAYSTEEYAIEFSHLENAHVIGQESTFLHVKVHLLMLRWSVRNSKQKEFIGQLFRIIGERFMVYVA